MAAQVPLRTLLVAQALLFGAVAEDVEVLPIFGGEKVQAAHEKWLEVWRGKYKPNKGAVPEVADNKLPGDLRGAEPIVIWSADGAAGGVVTEGIGYALMVEGFHAADGDEVARTNALSLTRTWLGMVQGPSDDVLGGGTGNETSATQVDTYPYGVSAIEGSDGSAASGAAVWKYPLDLCGETGCRGSASDGDQDAIMGMIYLAATLEYPEDFVDMVVRAVVSFASADLGFPDLYRTLPDGTKVFVPKGGSDWGSLTPTEGNFSTTQVPWCYSPGYFAPAHYRLMRAFAVNNWRSEFDAYLPRYLSGERTELSDLTDAFDGAVVAGYNLLYYSSCSSGAVSNWVGVKAECKDPEALHCEGVPWEHTPYVGKAGECTASGTSFGAYGTEASRVPWRIGMDFAIYPEWATKVNVYDRKGQKNDDMVFNAQTYLNRIAHQYSTLATRKPDPLSLSPAYTPTAPHLTCEGVPKEATANWWASMMSYPTFAGFIAPAEGIELWDAQQWMDALVGLCDISTMEGKFCDTSYFGVSQEVIGTMVISGVVKKGGPPPPPPSQKDKVTVLAAVNKAKREYVAEAAPTAPALKFVGAGVVIASFAAAAFTAVARARRRNSRYEPASQEFADAFAEALQA